ncbi:HD family phosphohydrolase [Leptospira sp. GIMC2001]|uniref:HD family phosphohydrolase n=1 Tax=Leptospira sp. GIMC2001 TaxID=1513297 RepID=UPI002349E0AC|nr:HD family phosphohydrolase [Leptospira sp. GIMC2001]WCL49186.1 GAF domain-containing protein [Leptospira sp. GIMC2001]
MDIQSCSVFISNSLTGLVNKSQNYKIVDTNFSQEINDFNLEGINHSLFVLNLEEFLTHGKNIWNQIRIRPELNSKFVLLTDKPFDEKSLSIVPSDIVYLVLPTNVSKMQMLKVVESSFAIMDLEIRNVLLQSSLYINTQDIRRITTVGQALATEHDFGKLIELILLKARELTSADGGSIYLGERPSNGGEPTHLRFMRSVLLLDADEFLLPIDSKSIAGHVALTKKPLLIDDVHTIPNTSEYNYNSDFDKAHNYYTKSMMTIPMTNPAGEIIGVIQLINRKKNFNKKLTIEEMQGDEVIPFSEKDYELVSSVAGQAAVAIDNQRLLNDQRLLLESFIQLIAGAIDSKSPYTGAHCERVPILTMMLAEAACNANNGVFRYFNLNDTERYELKIAAWLHDCGKVTTPVHVMDKATKLETIFDRIELVRARIEILRRDAEIEFLKSQISSQQPNGNNATSSHTELQTSNNSLSQRYEFRLKEIDEMEKLLVKTNEGTEFLPDEVVERIKKISGIEIKVGGQIEPLLSKNETENLVIRKGTLIEDERLIINGHMVETIKMLEALPFPSNLKRVPEYAGGHHEKMDGKGYPKGLYGGDMSIPARIMAIADVFEALTAQDRPYKKGKPLSETMKIMGYMKMDNHLDPDLLDLFITSGVYREYAKKFLPEDLIDEVDESAILSIIPKPFNLPPKPERDQRWVGFLPEYQSRLTKGSSPFTYSRDDMKQIQS